MRDITLCHPRLQQLAAKWIQACAAQGIIVGIAETLRTVEEQEELYAQGRTKPGQIVTNARGTSYRSQHQWGIAFDFFLMMDVDGDGKTSDDSYNDSTGLFGRAAAIAKSLGLAWGGDWSSLVDKPHLYLPDWGSTPTKLIQTYGTPEAFMRTWAPTAGWVRTGIGYWYQRADGTYPANQWCIINHHWYLFNSDGYMMTGWHRWMAMCATRMMDRAIGISWTTRRAAPWRAPAGIRDPMGPRRFGRLIWPTRFKHNNSGIPVSRRPACSYVLYLPSPKARNPS